MKFRMIGILCVVVALAPGLARGEILAMVNYESKTAEALKALKLTGPPRREDGIAIIDVDPMSAAFGTILMTIPLPPDMATHHIFYNRDMRKAYITAFGQSSLYVIDMGRFPYRLRTIDVPGCKTAEDIVFSADNRTWYLTCMGSGNLFVGAADSDAVKAAITLPKPYPHGVAVHNGIDRALVTNTVRDSDLGDAGETITVIEASTSKVLATHKVSNKPSPSGEAPVEILFVPGSSPPVAYITNMFGGTLWTATWDPAKKDFTVAQAFDFSKIGAGVPLEIYFNAKVDRLYVTTAKPGKLHIFDVGRDPARPKLLKTLAIAAGAHHVAFTRDERYAFVQNALLNLPGMDDGSITVVDLQKQEVVGSIDTLKNLGFNPNSIVLLPEWNHLAGH